MISLTPIAGRTCAHAWRRIAVALGVSRISAPTLSALRFWPVYGLIPKVSRKATCATLIESPEEREPPGFLPHREEENHVAPLRDTASLHTNRVRKRRGEPNSLPKLTSNRLGEALYATAALNHIGGALVNPLIRYR
jgi:hypothetical protein